MKRHRLLCPVKRTAEGKGHRTHQESTQWLGEHDSSRHALTTTCLQADTVSRYLKIELKLIVRLATSLPGWTYCSKIISNDLGAASQSGRTYHCRPLATNSTPPHCQNNPSSRGKDANSAHVLAVKQHGRSIYQNQ